MKLPIYTGYDYCTKWGLFVNVDKTKVVIFRKGGVLSHNDFWFHGDTNLEIVDVTLALIYHTLDNFHVLKEILLIGVYVLSML